MIDFIPLTLSTAYTKLLNYISIIDTIAPADWSPMHTLAYICYKYKEKFGSDFILSYKDTPSKSPEYKLTARIWLMLQAKSGDGPLVKDYIDWFYDNYKGKRRFISIGALAKIEMVSAFNDHKQNKLKLKISTILPDKYMNILSKYDSTSYVKTYGDLYFLYESIKNDQDYKDVVNDMKQAGFNFNVLKEIN